MSTYYECGYDFTANKEIFQCTISQCQLINLTNPGTNPIKFAFGVIPILELVLVCSKKIKCDILNILN